MGEQALLYMLMGEKTGIYTPGEKFSKIYENHKLKVHMTFDPPIPLLGFYPTKITTLI